MALVHSTEQAHAVRFGVEHFSSLTPLNTGMTDAREELLVAVPDAGGGFERAIWDYSEVRDQALRVAPFRATAEAVQGGYTVVVTATGYVRDLFLQADRVDPAARVDRGRVSLLPSDVVHFFVASSMPVEPSRFLDRNVLRSSNQLSAASLDAERPRAESGPRVTTTGRRRTD